MSYYLVTQYTCLVFGFVILKFPKSAGELFRLVFFQFPLSEWFFITRFALILAFELINYINTNYPLRSLICLIGTLVITNRVKSEFVSPWMIIVFSIIYPFYLVFTATIGLYGHARQVVMYSSWNPTARS